MFNFFRSESKTRTGMVASTLKTKRLKTKKEMQKLKRKLPEDYLLISEGIFSEMSEITSSVYLTGIFGLTKDNFDQKKISDVVNVTYEAPDIEIKGITYIRILVDDDPEEQLLPHFDIASDHINHVVKKGNRSVVHCVAGVSRSTAIVLSYLIKYKNMDLKNAFKLVYSRRSCVKPILGFMRQLIQYEKRIRGQTSCEIVTYRKDGVTINTPDFWISEYPQLVELDIEVKKLEKSQKEKSKSSIDSNIGNTNENNE